MLAKLIENWLDSAGERTYQPAFCQMLRAQGYTVVHSTRHCNVEYGKDVIAIAPDGVPCAFQLKGNPGGALNLKQYRDIVPQLLEMVNQRMGHPSVPEAPHRSYLVTNGRIEEEVTDAIDKSNALNERDGVGHRRLETVSREQVLSWAGGLEHSLWPSEVTEVKILLEIFTEGGGGEFPTEKFHELLTPLLKVHTDGTEAKIAAEDFKRRVASAALLTSVALKSFSEAGNHWATITAWTMLGTYLIAAAEKHGRPIKDIKDELDIAEDAIRDALAQLFEEAEPHKGALLQGNPATDFVIREWRDNLLNGLFSIYWLDGNRTGVWNRENLKERLEAFISTYPDCFEVWGEGAMPPRLLHLMYLKKVGREAEYQSGVTALADVLLTKPLYQPYYPAEKVLQQQLADTLEIPKPIKEDLPNEPKDSYFTDVMLSQLALAGQKEECASRWPAFTHVGARRFIAPHQWMHCLWRTEVGENHQTMLPETGEWADIVALNDLPVEETVPDALASRPLLLGIWGIIAPQRAVLPVVTHLHKVYVENIQYSPAKARKIAIPKKKSAGKK